MSLEPVVSLLNCDDSSPIAPGGVERFAMEIDVPSDTQLDAASIIWRLEPAIDAAFSSEVLVEQ